MTPECVRLGLVARPIESEHDVEVLRLIRNACKDGFSHDNSEISPQQQDAWWTLMRDRVKGWLYWTRLRLEDGTVLDGFPPPLGDVVGYGLLRMTDDWRWWSSVATLPEFMGRGYGGAITADLVRRVPHAVWATARLDNPAAMRLHRAADWFLMPSDDEERLACYQTMPHVYRQAYVDHLMAGARA